MAETDFKRRLTILDQFSDVTEFRYAPVGYDDMGRSIAWIFSDHELPDDPRIVGESAFCADISTLRQVADMVFFNQYDVSRIPSLQRSLRDQKWAVLPVASDYRRNIFYREVPVSLRDAFRCAESILGQLTRKEVKNISGATRKVMRKTMERNISSLF